MSISPQANSLKILTIENHQRSQFTRVGSCLLEVANRIREERGLRDISLICQDEGAAVFFRKNGFGFVGHAAAEKNAALAKRIDRPDDPLPDEVILVGDMVKS